MTTLAIEPIYLHNAFMADNRIASFAMPYLLASHSYTRVPAKGGGWHVQKDGQVLKIRALNKQGVSFGASNGKGVGRSATSTTWTDGLAGITGFLVYDAEDMTQGIHTWVVPVALVNQLRDQGVLDFGGAAKRRDILPWLEKL